MQCVCGFFQFDFVLLFDVTSQTQHDSVFAVSPKEFNTAHSVRERERERERENDTRNLTSVDINLHCQHITLPPIPKH